MPHRHLIRILDDERAQWLALDRAGRVLAGPTPDSRRTRRRAIPWFVLSAEVLPLRHRASRASAASSSAAVRHRGSAGEPVEQRHVAAFDDGRPETVLVLAAARAWRRGWRSFPCHGVRADCLVPKA